VSKKNHRGPKWAVDQIKKKEAGKGEIQRTVDRKKFEKNWDDIFKEKKE